MKFLKSLYHWSGFPILMLLMSMVSMQSGAALAKTLFPILGPESTACFRVSFAAILLCAVWRPWRHRITLSQLRSIAIYGISLAFMNLTFYIAIERVSLGIAIALEFSGPLAVALFSSRSLFDLIWALLAAVGILLILPISSGPGSSFLASSLDPVGVFFSFAAGVFWAVYILFGKRVGRTGHAGVATSVGMLLGSISILPFGITKFSSEWLSLTALVPALGVALLSGAVPYSIEMAVLKRISQQTFGILMSLAPAVGALAGLIFLGESLKGVQWLAILLVIAASIGSTAGIGSRKAKSSKVVDVQLVPD